MLIQKAMRSSRLRPSSLTFCSSAVASTKLQKSAPKITMTTRGKMSSSHLLA